VVRHVESLVLECLPVHFQKAREQLLRRFPGRQVPSFNQYVIARAISQTDPRRTIKLGFPPRNPIVAQVTAARFWTNHDGDGF
jgi:hypothetical protein